ncbi:type II toxin-antitoxin system HigB family toxin [Arcticibacter tournemirensis]|uniref:Type II toxin-antitoxin system HigB family toxin n=2 Tax=Arcticibacter tournemirensis TaxID=699437 RepID=A0A5M9H731_9SPHI|nr:type II toxin-antitoxin system HigB family toxin [Arcticibacter tournemirensis]
MVIIAKTIINNFAEKHITSKSALNSWFHIVKQSDWRNFSDVKNTFGSVDAVGNDRYVFNIKGNDFRLVAMIFFDKRTVYIRFVGTHAEYDKIADCSRV